MRRSISYLTLALASALVTSTRLATAEPADCSSARGHADRLRAEHKLVEARATLVTCTEQCEGEVRDACLQSATEVLDRTPTVVIEATDRQGTTLTDVAVAVDGTIVAQELDGKAIALDPGPHRIVLNRHGASVSADVELEEATKATPLRFVLRSAADLDGPARDLRGHTVWPWAIVGLGSAIVAGGIAIILTSPDLPASCDSGARICTRLPNETNQSYEQRQEQAGLAADQPLIGGLLIGLGAIVAGGGLAWHFLEPTEPRAAWSRPRLQPWFGAAGGGVTTRVAF